MKLRPLIDSGVISTRGRRSVGRRVIVAFDAVTVNEGFPFSFAMTFITMPYYVNPLLKHWLRPPANAPQSRANWRGIAISIAALAIWSVVFYLVTRVFWHLP